MLDEFEICEEVQALLNRMDMFPEEFSFRESEEPRWLGIVHEIEGENPSLLNPFTSKERLVLRLKLREVARLLVKRQILKDLTNPRGHK